MLLLFLGIALGTYIVYALQAEKTPEEPLNRVRTIPKYTHFSIDDATQIFQDIAFHEYESIFENEVLGKLRDFHEEYGLKATLYVLENWIPMIWRIFRIPTRRNLRTTQTG